eukprot:scaffold7190_cov193-Amphora_coffeaeformis.AAC.2
MGGERAPTKGKDFPERLPMQVDCCLEFAVLLLSLFNSVKPQQLQLERVLTRMYYVYEIAQKKGRRDKGQDRLCSTILGMMMFLQTGNDAKRRTQTVPEKWSAPGSSSFREGGRIFLRVAFQSIRYNSRSPRHHGGTSTI